MLTCRSREGGRPGAAVRWRSHLLATAGLVIGSAYMAAPARAAEAAPETSPQAPATISEVVVTASRRSEEAYKLPFNISAYGGQQLKAANITDFAQLSRAVPNFVMIDVGAGYSASSVPIIRGLNASQPAGAGAGFLARRFESPVGLYLGDAPFIGYIPFQDVTRVEVLRGPQGTLYGSGALGGAVRVIPTEPILRAFSGEVSGAVGGVSHSKKLDSDIQGIINVPVGADAALRIVAGRKYDAGFINQRDIMRRQGDDYLSGVPIAADPSDINSPAAYFNQDDANYSESDAARAMFVWKPNDKLKLLTTYSYSYLKGQGGPVDNHTYPGGLSPIDPRIRLAATGNYELSDPSLAPFNRTTQLASIDLSYDLGFATLSSTVAYGTTRGHVVHDSTVNYVGQSWSSYYTGTPANPRFLSPALDFDHERRTSEEVRLISKESGRFDYVVGAYFEQNHRFLRGADYEPGADIYTAATHGGSKVPIVEGGTYVPLLPNGLSFTDDETQDFKDYSVYGDLTWHLSPNWQVTGGVRIFKQTSSDTTYQLDTVYEYTSTYTSSASHPGKIFKLNTSYELTPGSQVYATFSQGYRRGGSSAFNTARAGSDPASLETFIADTTNNYEIGYKGRLGSYHIAADLFFIDWQNPQIDTATPINGNAVIINGKAATSKGGELELSGPLMIDGLSFNLGLAYARARLSEDFALPCGNGRGGANGAKISNCMIGKAGDRLPGAPDFSGTLNVNYEVALANDASLLFNLGGDYRGSTTNALPGPQAVVGTTRGFTLLHGSIQYKRKSWQVELYGTNLTDKYAVATVGFASHNSLATTGAWGQSYVVTRPREVGLRVTKQF